MNHQSLSLAVVPTILMVVEQFQQLANLSFPGTSAKLSSGVIADYSGAQCVGTFVS